MGDFLSVLAAGNFGAEEMESTVTSPAVAKNVVAVGATLTSQEVSAAGWGGVGWCGVACRAVGWVWHGALWT